MYINAAAGQSDFDGRGVIMWLFIIVINIFL